VRQLVAESVLISAAGAGAGAVLAQSLSRVLVASLTTQNERVFVEVAWLKALGRSSLDKLPPDQKCAVVLRRIVGHTEEQTAKICKVDKRTIRYRLAAADKQLKTMKEDL
jgi:DNA-directed RNA polymerase specialized sigma24 family protein